jgi:hypothetical protein
MKENNSSGWTSLLEGFPWFEGSDNFHIPAYSEFMPSPKVGISPYGDIDYSIFSKEDVFGWNISEIEEEMELKPGMDQIGKQILKQIQHLGKGLPAHHIAGHANHNLTNNPYWPEELSNMVGKLNHEKYVSLLPLMLSRTQDDKGRVSWTYFGSSIQGPEEAFWKSFYTAPGTEISDNISLEFFKTLLENVYHEKSDSNTSLTKLGFYILPTNEHDQLPSFTKKYILTDKDSFANIKYLLTFRPFSQLPNIVKEKYLSGQLHLLPFPGSLVFWGMPTYNKLAKNFPLAKQIPLQNLIPRHRGRGSIRTTQTGWIHEPHPDVDISKVHHHLLHDNYHRTHRWQRIHTHENELAMPTRISGIVKTLFSTELSSLGLYDKPMARNSQIWSKDFDLVLDGPNASKQKFTEVEKKLLGGGLFGYRFFYLPMQTGLHYIYWHRPLIGYFSEKTGEMEVLQTTLNGYITAYHKDDLKYSDPIELWPRILRRKTHLTAIHGFDRKHDHYAYQHALSIISLFEGWELFGKKPLSRCFAQRLAHIAKNKKLDHWLDELPALALKNEDGLWMKNEIEKLLEPKEQCEENDLSLTFSETANRSFEEKWWNDIKFLAHGNFINKDNADCVKDEDTTKHLTHHHRDLEKLGDYLIQRHRDAIKEAGMEGKAFCGELPFKWLTDFDFSVFGGWKHNHEGLTYERNILVVIPGKNRNEAVVMGDHYDTAYMEDVYDKDDGGTGARISANGADDNFSASTTLLLAAPIFLKMAKEGKLERDIWLIHLTGEEFPSDCMGARNFCERIIRKSLVLKIDKETQIDLSKTEIKGAFVMDMIGHNNDNNTDVFQISPGRSAESLQLAQQAHISNMLWNKHTHEWNQQPDRKHLPRGKRIKNDYETPEKAAFLTLEGNVRNHLDPHSSLFNTDGQIFSDTGAPIVLFMENYDISRTGYHDTHDTMENIDLDYGSAFAAICIETVARVATLPPNEIWKRENAIITDK